MLDSARGQSPAFLDGGGEMGGLMRAHDWSASSVGPPADWPQTLRTIVRLLLNTGHPMFLFWGEDGACFYNDAYRQSIGSERHPGALGRPAVEVWEEIWDVIGPQIRQVMSGRGATWHENQLLPITRNGRLETVYWTYSYCPVDDPDAPEGVGGVLVVCTETTEQVLAEQRLAAQADRQTKLFERAPGFIAVLNGPDHVFEFANEAYARVTGRTGFVGRSVRQVFTDLGGQGFFELLDRVYATGERYVAEQIPIRIQPNPGAPAQELALDFIYEPIRDDAGRVTGVFVEGHDVTEACRAARTLERNNRHLRLLTDELNHRVKNTLAIVQGLAQQTFRGDAARPDARLAFEGRLVALAAAHNVLTSENWESASLRDIVEAALNAHAAFSDRFSFEGPAVRLEPQTGVTLAMALHELTTNAIKYGALSSEGGRISLSWMLLAREGSVAVVQLWWRESDGPAVAPPGREGFGMRMIRRALAGAGGEVALEFAPEGLVCRLELALHRDQHDA